MDFDKAKITIIINAIRVLALFFKQANSVKVSPVGLIICNRENVVEEFDALSLLF